MHMLAFNNHLKHTLCILPTGTEQPKCPVAMSFPSQVQNEDIKVTPDTSKVGDNKYVLPGGNEKRELTATITSQDSTGAILSAEFIISGNPTRNVEAFDSNGAAIPVVCFFYVPFLHF